MIRIVKPSTPDYPPELLQRMVVRLRAPFDLTGLGGTPGHITRVWFDASEGGIVGQWEAVR